MAGQGQRFKNDGFSTPKHMIIARGRPLMEWALLSLTAFFESWQFVFVTRRETGDKEVIRRMCNNLGIKSHVIVELSEVTSGQAATVFLAESAINIKKPILIYNIDTYVEPGCIMPSDFEDYRGYLHVFEAPGDHWSFIRLDEQRQIIEVTEKERVSNLCSIGMYYFSDFLLYRKFYKKYIHETENELYVAPIYNYLLEHMPKSIGFKVIDKSKVHALGTPEEVDLFDPEFRRNNN